MIMVKWTQLYFCMPFRFVFEAKAERFYAFWISFSFSNNVCLSLSSLIPVTNPMILINGTSKFPLKLFVVNTISAFLLIDGNSVMLHLFKLMWIPCSLHNALTSSVAMVDVATHFHKLLKYLLSSSLFPPKIYFSTAIAEISFITSSDVFAAFILFTNVSCWITPMTCFKIWRCCVPSFKPKTKIKQHQFLPLHLPFSSF